MLLFDAGNSRCKWAWEQGGHWRKRGVLQNEDTAAWLALRQQFAAESAPAKIIVSNVAGGKIEQKLLELCSVWQCAPQFVMAQAALCGVLNGYEEPAALGSDRWAALIAARDSVQGAALVVNCGTATTVDALSENGEFMGGLILPGMELMQRSLSVNTAQLPLRHGEIRDFPRNTADAIASGVVHATAGAIQHQYNMLAARGTVRCLVSGGAAARLLPHLACKAQYEEDMVLTGLRLIGSVD